MDLGLERVWRSYRGIGLVRIFHRLLAQMGLHIPPQLTATPGTDLVFYQNQWMPVTTFPMDVSSAGLQHVTGIVNLVAILVIVLITTVLVIGIKESANLNTAIVIVKLTVVGIFIVLGGYFLILHPSLAMHDLRIRSFRRRTGTGIFGWNGIALGAASVFFAYIGFDAVSTAAQEAKDPRKRTCRSAFSARSRSVLCFTSLSPTDSQAGLRDYKELNVAAPVALGIKVTEIVGQAAGEHRGGSWFGDRDAGDAAGAITGVLLHVEGRAVAQVAVTAMRGDGPSFDMEKNTRDCPSSITSIRSPNQKPPQCSPAARPNQFPSP